jgi:tight adherence protein B
MRGRFAGRAAALFAGLLASCALATGGAAYADGGAGTATIAHLEPGDEGLQILVSVPEGADVNLEAVTATIAGQDAVVTAGLASDGEAVRRTAVLAIDTSKSMRGPRFEAAKAAALAFLAAVPDNVYVGIVSFDSTVKRTLLPTLDRNAARLAIGSLDLALKTRLYDGVLEAVKLAGDEGQRSILVMSDGLDTSKTPLTDVTAAIKDSSVIVDTVALEQSAHDSVPLQSMASAGHGQLINADAEALQSAFSAEADALARQVLVTAVVPASVTATEGRIRVTVPTRTGQTWVAEAFGPIQAAVAVASHAPTTSSGSRISRNVMYAGVGALGLGMFVLLVTLAFMLTAAPGPETVEARIGAFTTGKGSGAVHLAKPQDLRSQASSAAAEMLHRNRTLEARIANRLESAGSALKPSEWLLLHGGIAIGAGFVGLLLARGLGLVIFLLLGLVVPWLWLGFRRTRRLKAFSSSLADTLQLMSGSLSAGLSLAQSLDTIVREGNEPITGEFKRVLVEARLGVHLEDALEGVAERMGSKDFGWVVMAIRIQREVGGNLAELLTNVAATLREREYLRRQVATLSAEGRLSAWIIGLLPPLFVLYLLLTQPDYLAPMYSTPLGWLMLIAAGILLSVGVFSMSRIVKVEV